MLLHELEKTSIPIDFEIILIDDGSNPPIAPFLSPFIKKFPKLRLFKLLKNSGKGNAIRIGIRYAKGTYVLIQDADMEYHPKDIPKLILPILKNEATVVYGNRAQHFIHHMSQLHIIGNRFLTFIANLIFDLQLEDIETGYKLIPLNYIKLFHLSSTDFDIEIELTAKLARHQIKIKEIPISYTYRLKGNAKISILDGLEAVLAMFYYRIFEKNIIFNRIYSGYKRWMRVILFRLFRNINF